MSHLMKQHNEKIELTPNQQSPREAKASDFVVENAREDSDPQFKDALKDSAVVASR